MKRPLPSTHPARPVQPLTLEERLTARQRRFVEEYLIDLNGTAAALRAGYSARSARHHGNNMVRNPGLVQDAIQAAIKERSERVGVTADRVVKELASIAFADLRDTMTWGVRGAKMKRSTNLSPEAAAAVAEVVVTNGRVTTHRVKLHDKGRALEMLARHLGMFTEKTEISGVNGGPIYTVDLATMSTEERNQRLAYLVNRAAVQKPDDLPKAADA